MEKLTALFPTQVGLEFFTLQRLTAFFKDSKIFQKASSIVTGLFANLTAVGSIKIESKIDVKLRGWLEREAYLALDRVDVYVPRNLAVPYSDYLVVLSKVGSELENSRKVLLTSTLATIGYYINAASGLKVHSLRTGPNLGDALAPNATKWIDASAAAMSACLSPAKLDELAPFTKAFKRNSEVDEVVTLAHELYAQQVVSLAKEIEAEALELYRQSEVLFDMIQHDERYSRPSNVVLQDLTHRLQAASAWVEFYATYAHQCQQVSVALADTVKRLSKIANA